MRSSACADRALDASRAPRSARRAALSSRSRRSASGVCVGENNRPLKGVTRRSPARQPVCASRAMARSASQSPGGGGSCSAASRNPRGCSSPGRWGATEGPALALQRTAGRACGRRSSAPARSCPRRQTVFARPSPPGRHTQCWPAGGLCRRRARTGFRPTLRGRLAQRSTNTGWRADPIRPRAREAIAVSLGPDPSAVAPRQVQQSSANASGLSSARSRSMSR